MGGTAQAAGDFIRRETQLWQSIAKQVHLVPGPM
jgi:hypothetical protein